jgi:hypothetical protein
LAQVQQNTMPGIAAKPATSVTTPSSPKNVARKEEVVVPAATLPNSQSVGPSPKRRTIAREPELVIPNANTSTSGSNQPKITSTPTATTSAATRSATPQPGVTYQSAGAGDVKSQSSVTSAPASATPSATNIPNGSVPAPSEVQPKTPEAPQRPGNNGNEELKNPTHTQIPQPDTGDGKLKGQQPNKPASVNPLLRIKALLTYNKPAKWITSIFAVVLVAVGGTAGVKKARSLRIDSEQEATDREGILEEYQQAESIAS